MKEQLSETVLFDPSNPYHIMHHHFERSVASSLERAMSLTAFRELPVVDQVRVLAEGTLSGLCTALVLATGGNAPDEKLISSINQILPAAIGNGREELKQQREGPNGRQRQ